MKQDSALSESDVRHIFAVTAHALSLPVPALSTAQATLLAELCRELASGAARLGLTNYSSPGIVLDRLIAPALAAFAWLEADAPLCVAEIGAGSGALGMTLAVLCPCWRVTLVDRREKACRFAEVLALRLGLKRVKVLQADARTPGSLTERFDSTLFRAVASPLGDLAIASGWLQPSGTAILWTSVAKTETLDVVPGWAFLGRKVVTGRKSWAAVAFAKQDSDSPH